MSLALTCSYNAIATGLPVQLVGTGGTEPYAYSVLPDGAGGTINPTTGLYTAPATINSQFPSKLYDTIQVTDALAATATFRMFVGNPLLLFCNILERELGLASGRVYLWDQKLMQPTDSGLYVAVSVPSCKPFANTNKLNSAGNAVQSVNMQATVDIDIISRGPEARDRKEEVILALNSDYAQSQQEINSFYIAKLPPGSRFLNLSNIDGAAIPYRYKVSINMQYAVTKTKAVPYIDTFSDVQVNTNP